MTSIELLPLATQLLGSLASKVLHSAESPFSRLLAAGPSDPGNDELSHSAAELESLQPRRTAHLERQAAAELKEITQYLSEVLQARGFESASGFELSTSAFGGLRVDGQHPQRAELEAALQEEPQISEALRRIEALLSSARREQADLRLIWHGDQQVSLQFD